MGGDGGGDTGVADVVSAELFFVKPGSGECVSISEFSPASVRRMFMSGS